MSDALPFLALVGGILFGAVGLVAVGVKIVTGNSPKWFPPIGSRIPRPSPKE